MSNNKTKVIEYSFLDKVNKFFFSPKVFIILVGILIFAVLNYVFFSLSTEGGAFAFANVEWWGDPIYGDSAMAWYAYINITISTIGGLLSIAGVILVVRLDKRFIWLVVIGNLFVVLDSLLVEAIMTSVSYVTTIIIAIHGYFTWGEGGEDDLNKMKPIHYLYCGLALLGYILIGVLVNIALGNSLTGSFNDVWGTWYDIIGSGLVIAAEVMLYKKYKNAFYIFVATDVIYMFYFFTLGLWSTAASYIVYIFSDSVSMLTWWEKDKRIQEGKSLKV